MKKIEKILQHLKNEGVDIAKFERKSGLSNGYFANTSKRGADITQKILDKIKDQQPEIYFDIFPDEKAEKDVNHPPLEQDYRLKYEQSREEIIAIMKAHAETINQNSIRFAAAIENITKHVANVDFNLTEARKDFDAATQTQIDNQQILRKRQEEILQGVYALGQQLSGIPGNKSSAVHGDVKQADKIKS